jgi:hypothetical protein
MFKFQCVARQIGDLERDCEMNRESSFADRSINAEAFCLAHKTISGG